MSNLAPQAPMQLSADEIALLRTAALSQFAGPSLRAVALMGSYARGEAVRFSDVDVVMFSDSAVVPSPAARFLVGKYVVFSYVAIAEVDNWFEAPELATELVGGLQTMEPWWDPTGYVQSLRQRARAFRWTPALRNRARVYVPRELLLLGEEVYKGIQGLTASSPGRMLNSIFGLSHGLARVARVRHGWILPSDNAHFEAFQSYYAADEHIGPLIPATFGLTELSLPQRIRAGLRLYRALLERYSPLFAPEQRPLADRLLADIELALAD